MRKGIFTIEETLSHIETALQRNRRLGGAAQRLVRRAMLFMQDHYAEPLSREQIANHIGVHENHLTDCFHQEMGITPITFLTRVRVQQAKHLLAHTPRSITILRFRVGFTESAYFSRVFHREVGQTPRAYRRAHQT
ncbi:MAG: helix-turn-helix domain-containing protein [Blastochloris sp.]|nr:helix-turn-helix domain-containing protein [Blastochloris sp.]